MSDKYFQVDMQLAVGIVVPAQAENEALAVARKRLKESLTAKFSSWGLRIDIQEATPKLATPPDRKM